MICGKSERMRDCRIERISVDVRKGSVRKTEGTQQGVVWSKGDETHLWYFYKRSEAVEISSDIYTHKTMALWVHVSLSYEGDRFSRPLAATNCFPFPLKLFFMNFSQERMMAFFFLASGNSFIWHIACSLAVNERSTKTFQLRILSLLRKLQIFTRRRRRWNLAKRARPTGLTTIEFRCLETVLATSNPVISRGCTSNYVLDYSSP